MTHRSLLYAAATLIVAIGGAACSADRTEPAAEGGSRTARDAVTVEGCLSGGPDGRFVVTAAPDPGVTAAARPGMGDRDTHSYVLIGGTNLQQHVGARVEVSGSLVGRGEELERTQTTESEGRPTGTSGETPKVETTEALDLQVRQLTVTSLRQISPSCQVNP